jgi:hypothetical protein
MFLTIFVATAPSTFSGSVWGSVLSGSYRDAVKPYTVAASMTGFLLFMPRFSSLSFPYRLRMVPSRTRQNHIAHLRESYGPVLRRNGH